ncbi:hypothetical protein NBRC116590_02980 [Pelagimonas sp. KU-00592-HH]|uniref:hypothetical protein n=1 Tax=Pelagimonas sp. KU-00592-HH TaxID=3127651 RepID=UPI0031028D36
MVIAGLDIATATGVCFGKPGQTPEFFTRDLGKGQTHDLRFSNVMRLTHELIDQHDVEFIGIEAPIINPRRDDKAKITLLHGLVACVRGWAHLRGVEARVFEIPTIDKNFLGAPSRGGRDARKWANHKQCQVRGWSPKTDDEADAGAVWDYACASQSRAYAIHTTPLFSRSNGTLPKSEGEKS